MKRLLIAAAFVCGALWFHPPTAHATTLLSGTSFTVSITDGTNGVNFTRPPTTGNPSPPPLFATGLFGAGRSPVTVTGLSDAIPSLSAGWSSTFDLFTLNPASTCNPTAVMGIGCSGGSGGTDTETVTLVLHSLNVLGKTLPDETITGTYTAKYSGQELSCAANDGKSPTSGQTDCLVWSGASSVFNGDVIETYNLGNGDDLLVRFNNATDWSLTPTIQFELVDAPVPEPASIALLGFGLLGTVAFARRRRA